MAREKKRPPPEEGGDLFAVMFTSLNLVLLSFFILLNAISVKDNARVRKALGSLRGTFGILPGGENLTNEGERMLRAEPVFEQLTGSEQGASHELEMLLRRAGRIDTDPDGVLVETSNGVRVSFKDRVLFASGAIELDPTAFPMLDRIGAVLGQVKGAVFVKGYADKSRPARFPSNVELSGTRAVRVARYLVEAVGLPAGRVRADGMGARKGDRKGRFVELVVPPDALRKETPTKVQR